ncbi:MAG: hypothetical protein AAFO91_19135, partial [Bacteroidota bacterium]
MLAKRGKTEEKRCEEEEKRRVNELIHQQQQKDTAINDAILNQLAANKNSDAEIQRMAEVLKSLSNMEVDEEDDVEIVVTEEADRQNCAGAPNDNSNKKRKSSKKSPPKKNQPQPPKNASEASRAFSNFMENRNTQSKEREEERVAPIVYQPGCGLHCASRGPHIHFQDEPSADPQQCLQQQVTAPLNPPLHHQRRAQQGDVAEDMVIVLSEEAALRKSMMAQQQAKEARPAKKFVEEGSLAFRATLQHFQSAVNIPGLSSKVKITELSHWFGGVAGELIASHSIYEDADIAYANLISELGFIYGGNTESMAPIINELKAGKLVAKNDHKAHLQFYSELVR